jgi:hypothetical protein
MERREIINKLSNLETRLHDLKLIQEDHDNFYNKNTSVKVEFEGRNYNQKAIELTFATNKELFNEYLISEIKLCETEIETLMKKLIEHEYDTI